MLQEFAEKKISAETQNSDIGFHWNLEQATLPDKLISFLAFGFEAGLQSHVTGIFDQITGTS